MSASILLVDDDPLLVRMMGAMLAGLGRIRFATNGAAAMQQLEQELPDLILLDAEMPGIDGFELCKTIRSQSEFDPIPIIFVTGHTGEAFEIRCLEAGAVDFIQKPVNIAVLKARVSTQLRLKEALDTIRHMALTDALTGLGNRRAFDSALAREWKQALRQGRSFGMLMIDVDRFKQYNDTYGHPAGDACLASVANAMQEALLRPHDTIARYGGEEFAVLLPDAGPEGVHIVAERLLQAVLALKIPHRYGVVDDVVSISLGGAVFVPTATESVAPTESMGSLIRRADEALYAAKQGGRARVHMDVAVPAAPRQ